MEVVHGLEYHSFDLTAALQPTLQHPGIRASSRHLYLKTQAPRSNYNPIHPLSLTHPQDLSPTQNPPVERFEDDDEQATSPQSRPVKRETGT